MTKRLRIAALLGFAVLAPVALLAEGETSFLGPNLWMDPAPATYQLQVTGTNLCAARTGPGSILRKPYLSLQNCNAGMFDQLLQFVPNKVATQVIPATSTLRWRMTTRGECASVARNVVFGPPSVDMLACDLPASANGNSAFRGGPDQSFVLRPLGRETVHIRYPDGRCWTVQGGNLTAGTQLVMEPCDGRAGQTFSMKFQNDVDEAPNDAAAELFG